MPSTVSIIQSMFNRPSNTTPYASGQLVANDIVAANVRPLFFANIGDKNRGGLIRKVRFRKSGTSLTNASFRIHLYRASGIVCSNGDGGTWLTNNVINYAGAMDVTCDRAFTDGAAGNGLPMVGSEINYDRNDFFGLIEARGAYTPIANELFDVELEVVQN